MWSLKGWVSDFRDLLFRKIGKTNGVKPILNELRFHFHGCKFILENAVSSYKIGSESVNTFDNIA